MDKYKNEHKIITFEKLIEFADEMRKYFINNTANVVIKSGVIMMNCIDPLTDSPALYFVMQDKIDGFISDLNSTYHKITMKINENIDLDRLAIAFIVSLYPYRVY